MDPLTLFQRCRQGDELAWEALVRQYQARILGLAFHYLGNAEESRDLAQEAFVRIYRKLHTCHDPDRFEAWMLRVARNACLDHLRRRKARPPLDDIPIEEVRGLADPASLPEEIWARDSRKGLIHRALQALSEINREIILLKDIQGLSFEEVAGMLELPVGTVKSRSNRARLALAREVVALEGEAGSSA